MSEKVSLSKLHLSHYLENYKHYLDDYKDKPFVLFEIGIADGDSLLYWRDEFPKATIVGLDLNKVTVDDPSGRIKIYQGKQQDEALLAKIAAECAPDGFDVIIDDGSHIGHYTRLSFWYLFKNALKKNGLYFIEDWGTGYWSNYPDGSPHHMSPVRPTVLENLFGNLQGIDFISNNAFLKKVANKLEFMSMRKRFPSHVNGMVGFVKELVDESGVADATDDRFGRGPQRKSHFQWLRISQGHVIIKKA